MSATTNAQQWNPTQANQESDAAYTADAQRVGGASTGQFPSAIANKLFYQLSTYITALAQMLAAKGYSTSDADIAVLTAVLTNLVTNADLAWLTAGLGISLTANGYIKLPAWLGGFTVQWGTVSSASTTDWPNGALAFPIAFSVACFAVVGNANAKVDGGDFTSSNGKIPIVAFSTPSTSGTTWRMDSNGGQEFAYGVPFTWIAIGV